MDPIKPKLSPPPPPPARSEPTAAPRPPPAARNTVNFAESDFTPSRPTAAIRLTGEQPAVQAQPYARANEPAQGPVTDPTIGGSGRGAGAASSRAYGPVQGPPLPFDGTQAQTISAAQQGAYGPIAQQIAQRYLTGTAPRAIEAGALPELISASAQMEPAEGDAFLTAALNHPESAAALVQAQKSPGYQNLSAEQKAQVHDVLQNAGYVGIRQLANILVQDPKRLLSAVPAPNSGTALSEVARLAASPLHPSFAQNGITTAQALDSLITDLANPRDVYQGEAGTCTVTSMQYDLVSRQPGEYARIIADLAVDGRSTLRGDGNGDGARDVLYAQTEYLRPGREGDRRRLTEVWFQSSAMELANGELDYNARYDININNRPLPSGEFGAYETFSGLYGLQQQEMLEALFDVDYTMYSGSPDALMRTLRNHPAAGEEYPIILNLTFDNAPGGGTQGPVTDPTIGGGGSHAVTFQEVKTVDGQERVYFRDPWANGQPMPPAQWDRSAGMYYMPADVFGARAERIHIAVETLNGQSVQPVRFRALGGPQPF